MPTAYFKEPKNWGEIETFANIDIGLIKHDFWLYEKIFFYDTCSFRYHANLSDDTVRILLDYFKSCNAIVVITRVILMELSSISGLLEMNYINYLRQITNNGIPVHILNEEDIYDMMSECFASASVINSYLSWAVRYVKMPVSTITTVLMRDKFLHQALIKGTDQDSTAIYKCFFATMRDNKESGDNLGEEILAICMHLLSHIPGIQDGKLNVITDDKGGAGKIASLMKKTKSHYTGSRIIVYSTPKLIQTMYKSGIKMDEKCIVSILSTISTKQLKIVGTTEYDLEVDDCISVDSRELAKWIMEPNKINILF